MTVKEAIAILQTKNPDALLVACDSDGDYEHEIEITERKAEKSFWDEETKEGFYIYINHSQPEKNTVDIVLIGV